MKGIMVLAASALLAVTGCSAGAAASQSAQPAAQTANVRVCKHYRTQRNYVLNLAKPTLADALKVATWVAADAVQATPGTAVARDLNTMSADQRHLKSTYAISARVRADCTALGVKFAP